LRKHTFADNSSAGIIQRDCDALRSQAVARSGTGAATPMHKVKGRK